MKSDKLGAPFILLIFFIGITFFVVNRFEILDVHGHKEGGTVEPKSGKNKEKETTVTTPVPQSQIMEILEKIENDDIKSAKALFNVKGKAESDLSTDQKEYLIRFFNFYDKFYHKEENSQSFKEGCEDFLRENEISSLSFFIKNIPFIIIEKASISKAASPAFIVLRTLYKKMQPTEEELSKGTITIDSIYQNYTDSFYSEFEDRVYPDIKTIQAKMMSLEIDYLNTIKKTTRSIFFKKVFNWDKNGLKSLNEKAVNIIKEYNNLLGEHGNYKEGKEWFSAFKNITDYSKWYEMKNNKRNTLLFDSSKKFIGKIPGLR